MLLTRSICLFVAGVLMSLAVLAYASPPDPDWISGLWDNGDYDDVIIFVMSGVGITATHAIEDGRPFGVVSVPVSSPDETRLAARPRLASPTRAPPTV